MFKKLIEFIESSLKGTICGVLLITATATVITFAYFVIMSCYRACGSAWEHLFSEPWP